MKIMKHWKKALSLLMLVALVISSFAVSAQALTINPTWMFMYSDITSLDGFNDNLANATREKLSPRTFAPATNNGIVNLWVSSKDMEKDFSIPYVIDDDTKETWYLQQISISNMSVANMEGGIFHLMTPADIQSATKQEDFIVDLTSMDIDFPPYTVNTLSIYSIYYLWTLTPPENWSGDPINPPKAYSVSYDPNQAFFEDYTIQAIFPVEYDSSTDAPSINITDSGLFLTEITENAEKQVKNNQPFKIGDKTYYNYLVVAKPNNNSDSNSFVYFELKGWMGSNNKIYKPWKETSDFETLADANDSIAFTAQWKQIEMLSEAQLQKAKKSLPLNLIDAIDNTTYILYQWTDTDPNLRPTGTKSGDPVTLDEYGTIYYQLSAKYASDINKASAGAQTTYGADFASLTLQLTVDENLEFSEQNQDGTVSIQFSSPGMMPTAINVDGASISSKNGDDTYSITFDPQGVNITSSGEMDLQIGIKSVAVTGNDKFQAPFSVTGLAFKLKSDLADDPASIEINSSANITGTFDMKQKTPINLRNYFRTALTLLSKYSSTWESVMGGSINDTAALVRAVQFIDYKANAYDLSQDTQAITKANTVTATYPETIKVTPADITIYMGGDGGYDAVVGENGTTTSNTLPHPLFKVEVPAGSGIDPEDLIFANGTKTWTLIPDGNGYYHFSEGAGQDKVRVTYSYTDGNGVEHTVTNDTFDPSAVGDVYTSFTIAIYPGDNDLSQVTVTDGTGMHRLEVGTGTLTVRAVAENNAVSPVQNSVPTTPVTAGSGVLVADQDTTYTLNNLGVPLPADAEPSLLFDGIIDDSTHDRTGALVDTIEGKFDTIIRDGYFQAQYLDLVDANNGNAWIKASNDVTVYWGYPEGTNQSTKFTLYHFTDLHRDGINSGFYMEDISKSAIEVVDIEKTANGIAFDVEPGGFSPFVLVWEKPSWPIIIPDIPEDTTPELLNTYDHDAYLQGYPDGRVKPENNITRAEVATIFYRLLTDDARNYYYSTDSGFSDVKPGDWYNTAVSTMVNAGILTGYNDGSFRPNDPITRAEFATIAARFLSDPYSLQDRFYDTEGHWAEVYINRAAEVGWINGYNDGSFRPDQAITRAEAVTLVNNVLGREPHADYMLDDMITWPDNPKSAWYYEDIQEATNSHDYRWSSGKRYEIWTSLN